MANHITWKMTDGEKTQEVHLQVGDTVRVHYKLIEKEQVAGKTKRETKEETRERTQPYEGIIIAIKGGGNNGMFTVRRIGTGSIGIERIFPLISPWIKKIEVKKHGEVRRAKLYYMRDKKGKAASRLVERFQAEKPADAPVEAPVN